MEFLSRFWLVFDSFVFYLFSLFFTLYNLLLHLLFSKYISISPSYQINFTFFWFNFTFLFRDGKYTLQGFLLNKMWFSRRRSDCFSHFSSILFYFKCILLRHLISFFWNRNHNNWKCYYCFFSVWKNICKLIIFYEP